MEHSAKRLIDDALAKAGSWEALVDRVIYEERTLKRVKAGEVALSKKMRAVLEKYLAESLREPLAKYGKVQSNVDPKALKLRMIPVYSYVQAGQATDFEGQPTHWEDQVEYHGDDPQAFGLRITGDSMEPKYSPGDIVIVSPRHAAVNGQKVVAKIKGEGVLFKVMHHTGDGQIIELTSYNPVYPPIRRPREDFHWIYPVKNVWKL